jgi:hypothetical protein
MMPIKVKFLAGSSGSENRRGGGVTLTYDVYDTVKASYNDNEGNFASLLESMYEAVDSRAPDTFNGLCKEEISFREDDNRTRRFFFDVKYSFPPEATKRWSFDTSGGNVRISHSKATQRFAISGRTAPDCKSAIGVKHDGSVDGVDIVIPALKLTCSYRFPVASTVVNATTWDSYVKKLARMSGTTNNATYGEYARGELLFLGATGEFVPKVPTEIQYHFAASENVTGLTIGTIAGIAKKGHEFLWIMFEAAEDQSKIIQRPLAAYVEQVYGESNFADLEI